MFAMYEEENRSEWRGPMLNILVVDDESNIRKTLMLWLKSHGQRCVRRKTPETPLRKTATANSTLSSLI